MTNNNKTNVLDVCESTFRNWWHSPWNIQRRLLTNCKWECNGVFNLNKKQIITINEFKKKIALLTLEHKLKLITVILTPKQPRLSNSEKKDLCYTSMLRKKMATSHVDYYQCSDDTLCYESDVIHFRLLTFALLKYCYRRIK